MATPILDGLLFITASQDQSRRVISRVSLGQAGTTGSFQRIVKLVDTSERSYDSCLPGYEEFLQGTTSVRFTTSNSILGQPSKDSTVIIFNSAPGTAFESGSFYKNQFPYVGNPTRQVSQTAHVLSGNNYIIATDLDQLRNIDDSYSTYGYYVGASTADLIYRVGYEYSTAVSIISVTFRHREEYTAPEIVRPVFGPYRYGISNIKPEYTSARWNSNHYGYFRDMLEPRQLTARYDGFKPVKAKFVSGSTVLADPSDTHCQNLSTFATSSMPYFDDGVARNRSDNPDETLLIVLS
jgi:hypothetical protein